MSAERKSAINHLICKRQFRSDLVQSISKAAEEMNLKVSVKGREGYLFTNMYGGIVQVSEGFTYLEIGAGRKDVDLYKFWERVDKILAESPPP